MTIRPNDYAKYAPLSNVARKLTLIEKADEIVNIVDIYNAMGFNAPSGNYSSFKIHCPFGYEHSDGGLDKNCRIYPPLNIYCFAMHGSMKSTYLYARWKSINRKRAAIILLEERGLLKNKDYKEQWNELIDLREERLENNKLGDSAYIVDALQVALKATQTYSTVEYTEPVRSSWKSVLTSLDILWARPDTDLDKISKWFERALLKITKAAEEAIND